MRIIPILLLPITSFLTITTPPIYRYGDILTLPIVIIFTGLGFGVILFSIIGIVILIKHMPTWYHSRNAFSMHTFNTAMNNKVQVFPSKIIAKSFGFKESKMFGASQYERENVKVEF